MVGDIYTVGTESNGWIQVWYDQEGRGDWDTGGLVIWSKRIRCTDGKW